MENILHLPEYADTVGMANAQFMAPNLYPGAGMYERGFSLGLIAREMQKDLDLFFDRVGRHDTIKQFSLSEYISED